MNPPRILIVDDDPNMCLLVRFNLERRGWQVVTADDGLQGLELALNEPFDVVILDVMLPGASGFEVCAGIRRKHPASKLPVLLLTARSQMDDFETASNVGATDYVMKPFDPILLADQVAALLGDRAGAQS
ncbi:MAG: response regulator [bacterium]|nr:response regulator [Gemmatimonadota bacterium]